MSVELFAVIKRSSKYAYQQPKGADGKAIPFDVEIVESDYPVRGNGNRYRLSDVNFFVQPFDAMEGSKVAKFVRLA